MLTQPQNNLYDILNYNSSIFWSWKASNGTLNIANNDARCAAATPEGWIVLPCDTPLPVCCRAATANNRLVATEWSLSTNNYNYENAYCSSGSFSAPVSAYDSMYLRSVLQEAGPNTQAWIKLNALDEENCWVVDTADKPCPYVDISSLPITLTYLILSIIFICFVLYWIFYTRCVSYRALRAHRSRHRLIRDFHKTDFDGVPI
ncbi:hypothetical protein CANCADRAFT_30164 [Tortispora caseinolytica NRRL Y-17796]|uniref:C-type lectin domain-containing protein n=1 Tax=Tortispora caseinolytica NRRL Y-17796 TaxID=767744 RepID=A0A1E4TJG5_9ASCO|nr:hypothetical protein CANCADRAFT_30164 [Tortispora caseinolytica NRRL Y-17796]